MYVPKGLSNAWGWDTSETLDTAKAKTLAALGFKFGVRYVTNGSSPPSITAAELDALTSTGQGIMLVQFARKSGWSADTGHADGVTAAHAALAIGYPPGACLWFDLNPCSADVAIAYCNAWYQGAVSGGMYGSALGGYFEPGVQLTSSQLYNNLTIARYWRSGGQVPNVDHRGYQLVQAWPGNTIVAPGIVIDYDMSQPDFLGSAPVAAFKGT